jgi:hypothetical protein
MCARYSLTKEQIAMLIGEIEVILKDNHFNYARVPSVVEPTRAFKFAKAALVV